MADSRPTVAISMGDPAGIGPEIIIGAWPETFVHDICRPFVVGHPEILRRAARLWRLPIQIAEISHPSEAQPSPALLPCLPCGEDDVLQVRPGTVDPRAGRAAYQAVVQAAQLVLAGQADALTTAPLHKEALHLAGYHYPGHTELLACLCGVRDFAMMLYLGPGPEIRSPAGLAVVHVTLHTALRQIFEELSVENVLAKCRLADQFMRRLMLPGKRPRIGLAALNPHAGEGGLFGHEEKLILQPAVEQARQEGLDVHGPLPVDTLMVRARDGQFDAVVAIYHDQGHIALKLLGMYRAVNVTLGLPIVRTSVAHGTAFDIAWQRRAETAGMIEALRVAARLASKPSPK
ncbi:MAG: 4-hydroxythreonine-4-phosphate dehydrogenase PdxA [Thermoguttaceae bacterium]|nr:4-hydroxythreonine-4-phosphate dehydrogenase PdxA [Thermoguttaceae bacterium]MDW8039206.1 4-hydroxythreonine-4-phosphate dehydrogenase PdxA [Thermoguttaceae bacterium]